MNRKRGRLAQQIEQAERQADKWERAVAALAGQREAHRAERAEQDEMVAAANAHAADVRAKVTAPLIE